MRRMKRERKKNRKWKRKMLLFRFGYSHCVLLLVVLTLLLFGIGKHFAPLPCQKPSSTAKERTRDCGCRAICKCSHTYDCECVSTFVYKYTCKRISKISIERAEQMEMACAEKFSHKRKFAKFYHKTNISSEIIKCAHTKCR